MATEQETNEEVQEAVLELVFMMRRLPILLEVIDHFGRLPGGAEGLTDHFEETFDEIIFQNEDLLLMK